MDAEWLLTTTRAVRRRLDVHRPVRREVVEECVRLAVQAPSGGNRTAYRFVIVDEPSQRQALADIYRRAFELYLRSPQLVTRASSPEQEVSAVQTRILSSAQHLAENLEKVPVLVIPCMAGRAEDRATAHQQAGYWGSVIPSVWSFMLAARSKGLGTAYTTMHLRFEEEAAEVLAIPYDEVTQIALVPLAHTLGDEFSPASRPPARELIHWNRWDD